MREIDKVAQLVETMTSEYNAEISALLEHVNSYVRKDEIPFAKLCSANIESYRSNISALQDLLNRLREDE